MTNSSTNAFVPKGAISLVHERDFYRPMSSLKHLPRGDTTLDKAIRYRSKDPKQAEKELEEEKYILKVFDGLASKISNIEQELAALNDYDLPNKITKIHTAFFSLKSRAERYLDSKEHCDSYSKLMPDLKKQAEHKRLKIDAQNIIKKATDLLENKEMDSLKVIYNRLDAVAREFKSETKSFVPKGKDGEILLFTDEYHKVINNTSKSIIKECDDFKNSSVSKNLLKIIDLSKSCHSSMKDVLSSISSQSDIKIPPSLLASDIIESTKINRIEIQLGSLVKNIDNITAEINKLNVQIYSCKKSNSKLDTEMQGSRTIADELIDDLIANQEILTSNKDDLLKAKNSIFNDDLSQVISVLSRLILDNKDLESNKDKEISTKNEEVKNVENKLQDCNKEIKELELEKQSIIEEHKENIQLLSEQQNSLLNKRQEVAEYDEKVINVTKELSTKLETRRNFSTLLRKLSKVLTSALSNMKTSTSYSDPIINSISNENCVIKIAVVPSLTDEMHQGQKIVTIDLGNDPDFKKNERFITPLLKQINGISKGKKSNNASANLSTYTGLNVQKEFVSRAQIVIAQDFKISDPDIADAKENLTICGSHLSTLKLELEILKKSVASAEKDRLLLDQKASNQTDKIELSIKHLKEFNQQLDEENRVLVKLKNQQINIQESKNKMKDTEKSITKLQAEISKLKEEKSKIAKQEVIYIKKYAHKQGERETLSTKHSKDNKNLQDIKKSLLLTKTNPDIFKNFLNVTERFKETAETINSDVNSLRTGSRRKTNKIYNVVDKEILQKNNSNMATETSEQALNQFVTSDRGSKRPQTRARPQTRTSQTHQNRNNVERRSVTAKASVRTRDTSVREKRGNNSPGR